MLIKDLRARFRRIRPRMRPVLVVIGAQKAGTSALYKMLCSHPKAAPPMEKELSFFSREEHYAKGIGHYRSLFPPVPLKSFGHFTFEASPSYLFHAERAAPRIARHLPGTTCLAVLRDPVHRAYSAWNMCRDFQRKPHPLGLPEFRSFAQAVEDEIAGRTADERHRYLAKSSYADQVSAFQHHIPHGNLLVRSYLRLRREPADFLHDVFDHVGVQRMPAATDLSQIRSNVRAYPEPLDPVLAHDLYRYFEPEMNKLRQVLGYDLEILENHG